MSQPRAHALLMASLCGALILAGCDARTAEAPQAQEVDEQAAGLSDTMTQCGYECPPRGWHTRGWSCAPECGGTCGPWGNQVTCGVNTGTFTMCGYTCPNDFQPIGSSCKPECGPFCLAPYYSNATTCAPICDSREGTHGDMEADFRYYDAYANYEGWCTSLPTDVCVDGSYYYSRLLAGFFCHTVGSNGSCGDPDAIWEVNCRSRIDCVYDCEGACVKTDC
ncbi:hypothetical protein HV824_11590 [Myxococcus sp. AM009]|uniref:hypothetical protein n=1 Tax=Myxococcus sp. AM009 TaxID=2745137 RepID=UPI00159546CF|nr:hypothetical protein [Myxococcus sp. AM009]NVI98759.1 hypothetical protein [Myxococcus sp. AM009]